MSIPKKSDLLTLDYAWLGQPFVHVEAKPLETQTLDYAFRAQPFVAAPTTTDSAFDIDAAALAVFNGAAVRGAVFDMDAAATATFVGVAITSVVVAGAFDMDAAAVAVFNGASVADGAFDIDAQALASFIGASTAGAAFDMDAQALVRWVGSGGASGNTIITLGARPREMARKRIEEEEAELLAWLCETISKLDYAERVRRA
jgi:hypothetical protein